MNFSLSYNWLKEYVKIKKSPQEFAREFSLYSQSIERVRETRHEWKGVFTAKIVKIEKHPNAEKLQLATVEYSGKTLRVVCGAPNIQVGQVAPFVEEGGAVVRDKKPMTVRKVNIRGVESSGMLCSGMELGISDDHNGIFVLPPDTQIGAPLEKVLDMNDAIFDIEVTSNRPDCMSVIGIAREAGAVFGLPAEKSRNQENKKSRKSFDAAQDRQENSLSLRVRVQDKKLCPRYQAVVMAGIKIAPSPLWLQIRLIHSGIRPINNIVDITNYVMMEFGQPMHAFDYEILEGKSILIRTAKSGEKILALDGNVYSLSSEELVIADAKKPIAIAGVMGGEDSSVKEGTKAIVFECANFEPVSVRAASRRLKLFSQSSNLFEKGLSPKGTDEALMRAMELAQSVASAKAASKIFDIKIPEKKQKKLVFNPSFAAQYLGVEISKNQIIKILKSLGFKVNLGKLLLVEAPYFRARDVTSEADLIEEVARMHGLHKIHGILPAGRLSECSQSPILEWENWCKNLLSGAGFTEVYTYSMVSSEDLRRVGVSERDALEIYNPLSLEFQFMRPTVLPSLLHVLEKNQERGDSIRIFEISNVYAKLENESSFEELKLGIAILGAENTFYECKGVVEHLLRKSGIIRYEMKDAEVRSLWKRGGAIDVYVSGEHLGRFGELEQKFVKSFGVKKNVSCFLADFRIFSRNARKRKIFAPIPLYPSIFRDFAYILDRNVRWQILQRFIKNFHPLIKDIGFLSLYHGKELQGKSSLALRVEFRSDERTLKSEEVDKIAGDLSKKLGEKFGVKLR